mmetsp:Transcript_850/g.2736  ORF Transcript_850/g.2736 Transcript_850/m.2736 type:complete len:313 (-) Transcript_850:168-1106(-)
MSAGTPNSLKTACPRARATGCSWPPTSLTTGLSRGSGSSPRSISISMGSWTGRSGPGTPGRPSARAAPPTLTRTSPWPSSWLPSAGAATTAPRRGSRSRGCGSTRWTAALQQSCLEISGALAVRSTRPTLRLLGTRSSARRRASQPTGIASRTPASRPWPSATSATRARGSRRSGPTATARSVRSRASTPSTTGATPFGSPCAWPSARPGTATGGRCGRRSCSPASSARRAPPPCRRATRSKDSRCRPARPRSPAASSASLSPRRPRLSPAAWTLISGRPSGGRLPSRPARSRAATFATCCACSPCSSPPAS